MSELFYEVLRWADAQGITIREAAQRLEVDPSTIYRWKTMPPKEETARRILRVTGIRIRKQDGKGWKPGTEAEACREGVLRYAEKRGMSLREAMRELDIEPNTFYGWRHGAYIHSDTRERLREAGVRWQWDPEQSRGAAIGRRAYEAAMAWARARGLPEYKAAKALGLSRQALGRWKRGSCPRMESLCRIWKKGVDVNQIINGGKEPAGK